jgi:hypothetical protein
MPEYRLYIIDNADHIARRVDFDLPNEAEALIKARQHVDGHAVELWSGRRRIARINPQYR